MIDTGSCSLCADADVTLVDIGASAPSQTPLESNHSKHNSVIPDSFRRSCRLHSLLTLPHNQRQHPDTFIPGNERRLGTKLKAAKVIAASTGRTRMSDNRELPPLVAERQEGVVPDEGYSEHPLSAIGRRTMAVPRSVAARKASATNSTPHALAAAAMNVDVDDRISTYRFGTNMYLH